MVFQRKCDYLGKVGVVVFDHQGTLEGKGSPVRLVWTHSSLTADLESHREIGKDLKFASTH